MTLTLVGGVPTATFTSTTLTVGSHTITAVYNGDASDASSTSPTVTQLVNAAIKVNASAVVTSSLNPSVFGQSVTFTATVSAASPPGPGTPTGTVTFMDGAAVLGTGNLSAGVATFTTSSLISCNPTPSTAVYGGDGNASTASRPQPSRKW